MYQNQLVVMKLEPTLQYYLNTWSFICKNHVKTKSGVGTLLVDRHLNFGLYFIISQKYYSLQDDLLFKVIRVIQN